MEVVNVLNHIELFIVLTAAASRRCDGPLEGHANNTAPQSNNQSSESALYLDKFVNNYCLPLKPANIVGLTYISVYYASTH